MFERVFYRGGAEKIFNAKTLKRKDAKAERKAKVEFQTPTAFTISNAFLKSFASLRLCVKKKSRLCVKNQAAASVFLFAIVFSHS